jgi:hypothetical protein
MVPPITSTQAERLERDERAVSPIHGECALGKQSAPRIAASEEGVPALFGGVVSLDLINCISENLI